MAKVTKAQYGIRIEVQTDNAAFADVPGELASILESLARRLYDGEGITGAITDSNGNTVGSVSFVRL